MQVVGTSAKRVDGPDKVSGAAAYTGEVHLPGMAYAKLVPSPLPHATIKRIDASRARALPGVYAVLTGAELVGMEQTYGSERKDRPIVAIDKVRFQGEAVAAIAAVDEETAEAAVELVEVDYEELPPVTDMLAALEPDSPLVHPKNLCHEYHYDWGDVERGFAESDHVFEDTFTFPMVYHYAMEPHTCVARYDAEGITVWSSAQHPFIVRDELARIFHLPLNSVRVIVPYIGGGFGSKSYAKIEPLTTALAREAGRPVRLALTVEEAFKTVRRHSARATIKTGVMADGTFVARECLAYVDTGAYADNGVRVTQRIGDRMPGPYRFPHMKVDTYGVYTNTTPAGSYRSIGGPQAAWACESQMDIIAAALGMDPLALRLKNLAVPGEEVRRGRRPLEADLAMGIKAVTGSLGWTSYRPSSPRPGVRRGIGMACSITNAGANPTSTAIVRLLADGSAIVLVGTTELGQGSRTTMAQIAAEELGMSMDAVRVISSDTGIVPYDRSTGSSRSTTLMGLAVQGAAVEVRDQLLELATEHFESAPGGLTVADGAVAHGDERIGFPDLVKQKFDGEGGELIGRGYVSSQHESGKLKQEPVFWEVGMGAAEVEVDEATGQVRILRYVSGIDCGKAINPQQAEGQDEGAAMQAIGHTMFEEMVYEDGQLLNPNLIDYRVPTFADLPEVFETILIENGDGPGPYGAKGIGEGGVVSVAPAVANAIYNATGVRIKELPLTPERVWRALQAAKREGG
ncbi:MAG: xanthine dehydrogenase family protein molybdopterin-binding subunit [Chloroflexi bacterium]|nr:xanthine dehydrogenase family protein molybdopterin-binding subunit [Chloroflexota bacterium]